MLVFGASQEINEEFLEVFHKKGMLSNRSEHSLFGGEGMVLGEGSAGIVLESMEHALERQARIYCEIEGYLQVGTRKMFRQTEKLQGKAEIVVANASGTEIGDRVEAESIGSEMLVTAIKGNTGWIVSAAGIMDTGIGALMIKQGIVPPVFRDAQKIGVNSVKKLIQREVNKVGIHYVNIGGSAALLEISRVSVDEKSDHLNK